MTTSASAVAGAIGNFLAGIGSSLTSTQVGQLVTTVTGLVNPNAQTEHNELAKMAAFAATQPTLVPELAKQFALGADPVLAGAIAPLLTLPLPADALQLIMTVEAMVQQGM